MSKQTLLLIIAYIGFISLGLPDPVAGVAWPSVRETFKLTNSSFGLIFIALSSGYCLSSFFGGKLSQLLGVGLLLAVSSLMVSLSMFGSAIVPVWMFFVAVAVVWGLGSGAIDAGINVYVSKHFSSMHVSWLHACYSLGATLGPLLMTMVLVQAWSWRIGYALIGSLLLAMTITFLITRKMWDDPPQSEEHVEPTVYSIAETLRNPLVWFQIAIFFLYTGVEYMVGQWAFTLLTESRGVSKEAAGMLAGAYYGSIGVGRVVFGTIADRVGLDRLVRFSIFGAIIGSIIFAYGSPAGVGSAGLIIFGFGLAPIFPSLMARTPQRLGDGFATHAVGFQVSAAMLGAALLPTAAGLLAERAGLQSVATFSVAVAVVMGALHECLLWWNRRMAVEDATLKLPA